MCSSALAAPLVAEQRQSVGCGVQTLISTAPATFFVKTLPRCVEGIMMWLQDVPEGVMQSSHRNEFSVPQDTPDSRAQGIAAHETGPNSITPLNKSDGASSDASQPCACCGPMCTLMVKQLLELCPLRVRGSKWLAIYNVFQNIFAPVWYSNPG